MTIHMGSYRLNRCFTPETPVVDIVAVQGLWAHPKYTWRKDNVSWLADLLPGEIPHARINAFGPALGCSDHLLILLKFRQKFWVFASLGLVLLSLVIPSMRFILLAWALFFPSIRGLLFLQKYLVNLYTTPATEIQNQALMLLKGLKKKGGRDIPTILIGHSFGGLVIKQVAFQLFVPRAHFRYRDITDHIFEAVIIASTDAQYSCVYKSIVGLIFLGTPHRGTRLANAFKWWWLGASSDIRSVLAVESDILFELDRNFLNVPFVKDPQNLDKIHCFYELEPTTYGPSFLHLYSIITVTKDSATWPGRPSHGLKVRHSYLVKFSHRTDLNFRKIVAVLQDIIKITSLSGSRKNMSQ